MNSGNGKTFDPHRLLLNLSDKIDLERSNMLLYEILAYTVNGKRCKKNNKFKIPTPKWNEEFPLPEESYSVSDN